MFKKIFFIIVFIFTITSLGFSYSDNKSYVENLVKSHTEKAVAVINSKDLKEQEKKNKIFEIVSPLFDFKIMSKLALGKKYWNKLNDAQKKRFIKLFKKRVKMVYLDRVSLAGNLQVIYENSKTKGKKRIFAPMKFKIKDKNYAVLFKFWKSKNGWKIYDVEVEGISIIRTYRTQFHNILSKGSIDTLFKKLETIVEYK